MKKFWNKSATTNDIYIYGDITSEAWLDTDTTAKSFVEDLNSYGGQDVTVHLNSGGGDVFAGLTISNALKNYSGNVTVSIDGLAASAASLIAMGGKKICMAANALMMIHDPTVELYGCFSATELTKVQASLAAIHNSIVATYSARAKNIDVEKLLAEETWFSAQEALNAGLIDEITGEVPLQVDNVQRKIFVNSLAVDMKKFDEQKLRRAMEAKVVDKGFEQKYLASVRAAELSRIKNLQAQKCTNAAVNALIDCAVERGDTLEQITPYLSAVKNISATSQSTANEIKAMIRDQLKSGAEGVQGSQMQMTDEDIKKAQAALIVKYANGGI